MVGSRGSEGASAGTTSHALEELLQGAMVEQVAPLGGCESSAAAVGVAAVRVSRVRSRSGTGWRQPWRDPRR